MHFVMELGEYNKLYTIMHVVQCILRVMQITLIRIFPFLILIHSELLNLNH